MIDPILSLAFSMQSNKGIYALLLGSGVSRSAGIPTGWEVVLDLIRKLARTKGVNCEPDPAAWYADTFQEQPDYSKLLKQIVIRPSERSQLLRPYFEPRDDDERASGIKTPTEAHKAIARLMAAGYIKVIITTNFDRLLENALEDVGVIPTVISTPDAAQGAMPLVHTPCTIIKVHGDYLDTRIKNTPEEVSAYHARINKLLDHIFDEYGLIVCGWSAEWDIALQNALKRCKSRRFTTYWALKGNLSDAAKVLVDQRQAQVIPITSADAFFKDIEEKVMSISEFERPHSLSSKVAVATLKRYLEGKSTIRLHDLVMNEVDKVHENISPQILPTNGSFSSEELLHRLQRYDSTVEVLQAMLITGAYWGNGEMGELITRSLERLSDSLNDQSYFQPGFELELYPALVLMYAAGLASLAKGNYETLASCLLKPKNIYDSHGVRLLILSLCPPRVLDTRNGRVLPGRKTQYFPLSEYLFENLAGPVKEFIPNERQFNEVFDRLELFVAMVYADESLQRAELFWIPIGRFGWKYGNYQNQIVQVMSQEIDKAGDDWPPLKAGFFGGSIERAKKAFGEVLEFLKNRANYMMG